MNSQEITAILLALFAGLSTLIGWAIVVYSGKADRPGFMSLSMGFTAGVMIYLSFVELLGEAGHYLHEEYQEKGMLYAGLTFFGGMCLSALIGHLVPEKENPHELDHSKTPKGALYRISILTTVAVAVHNFPEGIATVFGGMHDVSLGFSIAIAIALHNIPEGIAISAPIYNRTGSKKKALYWTTVAAVAEPLGAIFAFSLLADVMNETFFNLMLSGIGGVMVFIAFDQILPATEIYGRHKATSYSIVAGMAVMAGTIIVTH